MLISLGFLQHTRADSASISVEVQLCTEKMLLEPKGDLGRANASDNWYKASHGNFCRGQISYDALL